MQPTEPKQPANPSDSPNDAPETILQLSLSKHQLVRWAAALCVADARLSLLYFRGDRRWWQGPGMLTHEDLEDGFLKARKCYAELESLLAASGVDAHTINRAMQESARGAYWLV